MKAGKRLLAEDVLTEEGSCRGRKKPGHGREPASKRRQAGSKTSRPPKRKKS